MYRLGRGKELSLSVSVSVSVSLSLSHTHTHTHTGTHAHLFFLSGSIWMDHRQGEEGRKQERVTWIDTVARWLPEEAETVLS